MTERLYLQDSYQKTCTAKVLTVVDNKQIILDTTIFYATSGGQPHDMGIITKGNASYNVVSVKKEGGHIIHYVDKPGPAVGDTVTCELDWQRRYMLMRYHSAAHVLSGVFHKELGVEMTGGQLDVDKGRFDFPMEHFSKENVEALFVKANNIVQQDLPIKVYTLSKEEALQDPTLFKLANKEYIEKLQSVRIVDIVGFDKQADGGTHVKSLKEIGNISLLKMENRGKNNKRVYFSVY